MIALSGVRKRYDALEALKGVDLEVEPGELLGLIGPNGAGKTSLLRIVATLSKPDEGRVRVLGCDPNVVPGKIRRRLGYMPAEFGRLPDMTVHEYLSYFAAAVGVPRRERLRRIEDVLELVDLVERRDTLVSAGSTGIKQRILIAKTLVHDPELLVLDEPAAGLDPRARVEVREVLKELNGLGKTIVVSSHILADLEEICDAIAILEAGELVARGPVAELKARLRAGRPRCSWRVVLRAEGSPSPLEVLAEVPGLGDLVALDDGMRFTTAERDANAALAALLAAGHVVLSFREEEPRLEEVFLRETEGLVT